MCAQVSHVDSSQWDKIVSEVESLFFIHLRSYSQDTVKLVKIVNYYFLLITEFYYSEYIYCKVSDAPKVVLHCQVMYCIVFMKNSY